MADFDFTQLKGRLAQAGKGGHVELTDMERNALIDALLALVGSPSPGVNEVVTEFMYPEGRPVGWTVFEKKTGHLWIQAGSPNYEWYMSYPFHI